ncbi:MAG: tetratricopeptide repeat protein [Candidatus Adiutrix sp.]|jgi:tetratricopeptide (TPR) repeat protein|nr:tetratricopeptide repeat protein [Candidatus Adiutrix sp.]
MLLKYIGLWAAALLFGAVFPLPALADQANTLTRVAISPGPDYRQLTFTFQNPLETYTVRRDDVDQVVVDFGPAQVARGLAAPPDDLITGLDLALTGGRLRAVVHLASTRYELRYFLSPDGLSCVLDIKTLAPAPPPEPETEEMAPLRLPDLAEVGRSLGLATPPREVAAAADNLYQRIAGQLEDHNNPAALSDINLFLEHFPEHPAADQVSYLKAELDFLSGQPEDTYAGAVAAFREALERWPQSVLAPRARFMLAEADRLTGHHNEAAGEFKILADEALLSDDIYARLALLRSADLLLNMGLIDEARNLLEPVIEKEPGSRLGLEAYARSGMADFYQGFFSQANEVFQEALKRNPSLYQTYPEMLYGLGEGYHYLERPDLSRQYLYQALNLLPEHPKADVFMARIGDDYHQEGREREAMAIYGAAQHNYPTGDGGLVSQMRLADMGALHSFFSQDKVFDALERGSRQATVAMYKKIAEAGANSPLLQLAQLKIGTALAEDGDIAEAIKWLRDLEVNYPRSPLLPEARPALNRSILEEIGLREELGEWQAITDLYADNSSYIAPEDQRPALRVVAKAYEKLGKYEDAHNIWRDLTEEEPDRRLLRAQSLVEDSLQMGQPRESLNYAVELINEFPGEQEWLDPVMSRIGQALARPQNEAATADLIRLADLASSEPARRDALTDAIEIEINGRRYGSATSLMDRYRREYPDDELTPEYILTQAKIAAYEKRPEQAWNYLSDFRLNFPDDPRVAGLLKNQIDEANALGRVDDALRFMELYRSRYPGQSDSREMMLDKIKREWELGRFDDSDESLASFRRDFRGDPGIPGLLADRSEQDWGRERYPAAQWALDELLLNYPDHPRTADLLLHRSEQDWGKERYPEARQALDELLKNYPDDPRTADLLLHRAESDWGRGRAGEAQGEWADFRRLFPDDPRVDSSYLDQYRKLVTAGQTKPAEALAAEMRHLRPQDTALLTELTLEEAKDFLAAGQVDDALARWDMFRQDFPQDPRLPDLLLVQARQEIKANHPDAALKHYQMILDQYPDHSRTPDVYQELAAAESRLGRLPEAWDHLDQFNRKFLDHPGRPRALLEQVELGQRLNRLDETIGLYQTFRQDYPNDPQVPPTYLAQARLEIAAGRPGPAAATLESGVLAWPALDTDPAVQALLTDLYLENGPVESWAALVERNLDRAANPAENLADRFLKFNQLAQVYQELGQVADAERNYDKALDNRPPEAAPETLYAIANAFKKMLRPEKQAGVLALLQQSADPLWQKVATEELAALEPQQEPQTPPPAN